MNEVEKEQLRMEIQHIFDSGANEIRIFEMVKSFIESRNGINKLPIHDVSYCAEQTKNFLTNKFCNIAKEHVGKTFDEVPEATDLLKAIDVIKKHCG
jgi:hypothetical protein